MESLGLRFFKHFCVTTICCLQRWNGPKSIWFFSSLFYVFIHADSIREKANALFPTWNIDDGYPKKLRLCSIRPWKMVLEYQRCGFLIFKFIWPIFSKVSSSRGFGLPRIYKKLQGKGLFDEKTSHYWYSKRKQHFAHIFKWIWWEKMSKE